MIGLRIKCFVILLVVAIGCTAHTNDSDADVPQAALPVATAQLDHEFNVVTAVRELADGRVLVSDERDAEILVVDFATGSATTIGRRGRGPGEYTKVARVWALNGDSSIMKEPFSSRAHILYGDSVVSTLDAANFVIGAMASYRVEGSDGVGRVVFFAAASAAAADGGEPESLLVVRASPAISRTDTVASIMSSEGWLRRAGTAVQKEQAASESASPSDRKIYAVAVSGPDQVALFPDGWLAIARTSPYRVDWCSPDLQCRPGKPIPHEQRPISEGDKQLYLTVAERSNTWPPTTSVSETSGWPTRFPPFAAPTSRIDASAVVALSDGTLLVERLPLANDTQLTYDVIDRAGVLVRHWHLEFGKRIVGASRDYLYVVSTMGDGTQRLGRHPWP